MGDEFHKPTKFSGSKFEAFKGGEDPAQISRVAHETAQRAARPGAQRPGSGGRRPSRRVHRRARHRRASPSCGPGPTPKSLPGALWRIYLLRLLIRQDPEGTAFLFQRGTEVIATIDPVVAGASMPTGPAEIIELADRILRGVFEGDFAVALDRAAAFCRVTAAGCTSVADDLDATEPERASELTTRALRFTKTAEELTSCARLWRHESLD